MILLAIMQLHKPQEYQMDRDRDTNLIRYLLRHNHTSPFEMIEFKFYCVMPIFVARQWLRHRTANVNEISGRYTKLSDSFYRPDNVFMQSKNNNQGSGVEANDELKKEFYDYLDESNIPYHLYKDLIDKGISREQARIGLPLSINTEMYWKCDLHNLFNFLRLRMANDAQLEIRQYAKSMYDIIRQYVPISCKAFEDYQLNSVRLTGPEVEALKNDSEISVKNSREQSEWIKKKTIL